MTHPKLDIRTMARRDLDIALDWAAAEGWNPGLNDADCYWAADPEGFLVGEVAGDPAAVISVVRYGDDFGFLGLYIVKPEYRRQGCGMQIWDAGMARLQGRRVGLDGVVEQQRNYARSGFALAHRNIRYQGTGGGQAGDAGVTALSALPFAMVNDYDRPMFPADRSCFLRAWIGQPGCHALGVMQGEALAGYGVMRPCRAGWKIGPLFADDPALADSLYRALAARAEPGDPVYLDVPEANDAAVALAERHGMNVVFETARMYTGAAPDLPLNRQFGVTSFELG